MKYGWNMTKILFFSVFWAAGIAAAFLGNRKLREWRCYENPVGFLVTGCFLCVFMSWVLVILLSLEGDWVLPESIWHNCRKHVHIHFEDVMEDGVHKTYRVHTCRTCGKTVKREEVGV